EDIEADIQAVGDRRSLAGLYFDLGILDLETVRGIDLRKLVPDGAGAVSEVAGERPEQAEHPGHDAAVISDPLDAELMAPPFGVGREEIAKQRIIWAASDVRIAAGLPVGIGADLGRVAHHQG